MATQRSTLALVQHPEQRRGSDGVEGHRQAGERARRRIDLERPRRAEAMRGFGGIRATPTSFLVDRDGRIVKRIIGNPDHRQLDALIDTLLPPAS